MHRTFLLFFYHYPESQNTSILPMCHLSSLGVNCYMLWMTEVMFSLCYKCVLLGIKAVVLAEVHLWHKLLKPQILHVSSQDQMCRTSFRLSCRFLICLIAYCQILHLKMSNRRLSLFIAENNVLQLVQVSMILAFVRPRTAQEAFSFFFSTLFTDFSHFEQKT